MAVLMGAVAAFFVVAIAIARPAMREARRQRDLRAADRAWQSQAGRVTRKHAP